MTAHRADGPAVVNPFLYTEPVAPDELVDRDAEAGMLVRTAVEGNNSRLVAPRRYGKTSLLRRAAADLPRGWVSVYVDFFGVLTVDDVAERIERAYATQLSGRLATWFTGLRRQLRPTVRLGGGPVPAGVDVHLQPAAAPLIDRLALPTRLHERHGRRVFVVFDEFQDVLAADDRIDAVIRSEIQHHGDAASYAFAGSHVGMMSRLFGDRRRAFYGQARPVDLTPLDDVELAEFIGERFERTGKSVGAALAPLLALVRGHPQRSMLAAHALWEATDDEATATEATWAAAYERIMADTRDELRAIWTGLPTGQRRVLATLSNGGALYGSRRPNGGSRGGGTKTALAALIDRGEVTADGGHRIIDPLLADWVSEGTPGA
jgi:hypothetical protein